MIDKINLAGQWEFALKDSTDASEPKKFSDTMTLPDTVSNARKCRKNDEICTGYLTDTYSYSGYAWFRREIDIASDLSGRNVFLFLERTRVTVLYFDNVRIGLQNSLCTPHRYDLTGKLTAGKHTLLIRVDNVNYATKGGHLTSPDTQTNWLGILGRMELQIFGAAFVKYAMVEPDVKRGEITVHGEIAGEKSGTLIAEVTENSALKALVKKTVEYSDGSFSFVYSVDCTDRLWSEFEHNTFTLSLDTGSDIYKSVFGMRNISSDGLTLLINGEETFLRGKHDGMIFPKTSYAPTDVESWINVMKTAKSYGINHYRFHTCCPPEAAFFAADKLGIYLQPELPFWGTVTTEADEKHNETEQRFLISEGIAILKEFSNHPSFVMMSLGNELWGNKERINSILAQYKALHPSVFYAGGSNNFQFYPEILSNEDFFSGVRFSKNRLFRGSYAMCDAPQGHIQLDAPNCCHNYDSLIVGSDSNDEAAEGGEIEIQYGTGVKKVKAEATEGGIVPDIPVISHEVGQYEFFPDFDEEALYTGSLKPLYLGVYRERLNKAGLYEKHGDFFNATGRLAIDCYKNEIETALRSRNLSGFQLLDLQDFTGQGVALVGVLNAFMQSKGLISAEKWREFCSQNVVLGEFSSYVYSTDDKPCLKILLSSYGKNKITSGILRVTYCNKSTETKFTAENKRLSEISELELNFSGIKSAQSVEVKLEILGTDIKNSYTLWVYPRADVTINENAIEFEGKRLTISHSQNEALKLMKSGAKTLLVTDGENAIANTYCTNFWNYPMFRSISESVNKPVPVGTLGMWIDDKSDALALFPTDSYSTPQWFEIVMHSHADILDGTDIQPIAQPIDNTERCHKLGLLYELDTEAGKLLTCTSRLWEISEKPEVKQFALSIAKYITE